MAQRPYAPMNTLRRRLLTERLPISGGKRDPQLRCPADECKLVLARHLVAAHATLPHGDHRVAHRQRENELRLRRVFLSERAPEVGICATQTSFTLLFRRKLG